VPLHRLHRPPYVLHDSTSRDIGQKPRAGAPPLSPLLMLLFFGFGAVFSFFSLFFYLVVVGLAFIVWSFTLSYLDLVFSVHIIQRHLFGCRFNGLLIGLPVGFALYTAICSPLKWIRFFLAYFLRMVCFSCTVIFYLSLLWRNPPLVYSNSCNLFSSPIFLI
jgi:hypothetical protein